jgi:hypothetical protein
MSDLENNDLKKYALEFIVDKAKKDLPTDMIIEEAQKIFDFITKT